ncbi:MAG: DUF669 domain-containing protein [Armatimonadota bacterium]
MSNDYDDANVQMPDLKEFDGETYEIRESDFEEVPDDTYQVRVHRVQLTTLDSGDKVLKWQFKVIGPKYEGRIIFRNNYTTTFANREWLINDLHKCGVKISHLSELLPRLGELLDICLEIKKETKGKYTNIYVNRRIVIDDAAAQADASLTPF